MPRSEWVARIALVPLGLLLTVALVELLLQAGALVVRGGRSELSTSWVGGGRRVLCLGDSNTYGVWLGDREREAYPPQLESLWNERHPEAPVEVLNAGYPGTNSSLIVRELPGMIEAFAPDLVIVMVGVNDFWTEPVPLEEDPKAGAAELLRRHSRVFRLFLLLRRRLEPAEVEVLVESGGLGRGEGQGVVRFGDAEFAMGWREQGRVRTLAALDLEENLGRLVERARRGNVELVLMTYPSSRRNYGTANAAIRAAAEGKGARLVELDLVFAPLCPEEECPDWLFRDHHPRASGYRRVAETLVDVLGEAAR